MEPILGMIADIGFPIVISVYLLVRIEKKMESLTVSIQSLTNAINKMK
ncbi:MAG: YvrJ family protein [Clostridia bacterium]|nr:YvrJ family protein [Clostridia bacterium]MDD4680681.1 YvrJ family protein [Clostridia bacterium]